MNKVYYLTIAILFFYLKGFTQEKQYDSYWLKSKEERKKIDQKYFEKDGLISMDSVSTEKIHLFLYHKGSGVYSLDRIYRPYFYNVIPIISDSLYDVGIFMFGVASSHPGDYIFLKEGERLIFLDHWKQYEDKRLVKRVLRFINRYEDKFIKKDRINVWKNITIFYQEYNGFVGN